MAKRARPRSAATPRKPVTTPPPTRRARRRPPPDFSLLCAHSTALLVIVDEDGALRYWNAAVTAALGYTDTTLPPTLHALIRPDEEPLLRTLLSTLRAQLTGTTQQCLLSMRRADGHWRRFAITATNLMATPGIDGVLLDARDVTTHDETEDALRRSEARYRDLVDLCPEPIIVHVDQKFAYANAAALTLFGATDVYQLLGTPIWEVIHPDSHAVVRQRLQQIRSEGRAAQLLELKLVRRDGTTFEAEVAGAAMTYGGVPAIQTVIRDLSQRKYADQAVRESEERYRNLFENANDAIAVFTVEGRLTNLNQGAEALLGWSREELIGQHYRRVVTPATAAIAEARTQRYLAGDELPSIFEAELVRKDGQVVPVEARTRPIRDAHGTVTSFQGIFRDITERKRAEQQLQESEHFRMRIADTVPYILYVVDLFTHDVLYVNRRLFTVLGYPLEHFQGPTKTLRWADLVHPDDQEPVRERERKVAVAADGDTLTTELRLKHASGAWRWLRLRETIFRRADDGTPMQIVGTAEDITERKRLEALLQERVFNRETMPIRLREFRRSLRLSQAEFGKQFGGYHQSQISDYEQGAFEVPLRLILAIRAHGYPFEMLVGGGGDDMLDRTLAYLPTTYYSKQLTQRLARAVVALLEHDTQEITDIVRALRLPLKDLSPVQQRLLTQLLEPPKESDE